MIEIIVCDDDKNCRNAVASVVKEFFSENNIPNKITKYSDYNDKFIEDICPSGKKIYILDIVNAPYLKAVFKYNAYKAKAGLLNLPYKRIYGLFTNNLLDACS